MTKVISISDEAYDKLKKLKDEKSFSEIIVELTLEKTNDNLMKFAGILSKEAGGKIIKQIYEERKISSRRFK
ncbi:MAG: antitoxin VapB family protein [Nanoarchaeota archaeon]